MLKLLDWTYAWLKPPVGVSRPENGKPPWVCALDWVNVPLVGVQLATFVVNVGLTLSARFGSSVDSSAPCTRPLLVYSSAVQRLVTLVTGSTSWVMYHSSGLMPNVWLVP